MALLNLVSHSAVDTFLTVPSHFYENLFDSLAWGEWHDLPRSERVAHLHDQWQSQLAADQALRYLVWAGRHSSDSPLYALPKLAACGIADHLRRSQSSHTRKLEKRYNTAIQLLKVLPD